MARTKATANPTIEEKINNEITSIESQIEQLQEKLSTWKRVASDYETNRTTVEHILSLQNSPDLAGPAPKKYKTKNSQ
jgi:prefoldin subunit 5